MSELYDVKLSEAEIIALFKETEYEVRGFEKIDPLSRMSSRPDIHAFMILDRLVPSPENLDMVSHAGHDEIYLAVGARELSGKAAKSDILDLIRCGVRVSDEGALCLFV